MAFDYALAWYVGGIAETVMARRRRGILGGVTREPARMPALPGRRNGWPGRAPPRLGVGAPASVPAAAFSLMEDQGAQQHPPARLSNGGQADGPAEVRPPSA